MKWEPAAQYTKRLLGTKVKIRKSLGQNFLIDDGIIEAIVQALPSEKSVPIVEVGAGLGVLTRRLLQEVDHLWTVEIDSEKVELLERELARELSDDKLAILQADARMLRLEDLWGEEQGWLVGNLPYNITNPLIKHFLAQHDFLQGMTVMVQKEVAERMIARPGGKDYGVFSIAVQLFAEPQILFTVRPSAFIPRPQVDSAVVNLRIRTHPQVNVPEEAFFRVVKAAFGSRRKMLVNTLAGGLNLDKALVTKKLAEAGIEETRRAETLSMAELAKLTAVFLL